MKLKFIDLFAGIGGFRTGLEMAGHECIGFCEADKYAIASYTSMHLITDEQRERLSSLSLRQRQKEILKDEYRNGEWFVNDIKNVTGTNIPKADCWCFGSPCQDFSLEGLKNGLQGDRSSLVREVFRILWEIEEEDRPEWLIYENVKGMFSSNRGFDYLSILIAMDELGYDVEWQILNSKNFGVPQTRERVFTCGHLRRKGRRQIFPVEGTNTQNCASVDIIGHKDNFRRNTQVYNPNGITETITTSGGGGRMGHVFIATESSNAEHYTVWSDKVKSYGMIRKLTPKEYFRLQGWSDDYFSKAAFVNTDSQLYKQAGNGVVVPVVKAIGEKINLI